jgi:hypothetical protein
MRLLREVTDDDKYKNTGIDRNGNSYHDEAIDWDRDFPEILRLGSTLPREEIHRLAVAALMPKSNDPNAIKDAHERIEMLDNAFKVGLTGNLFARQMAMKYPGNDKMQKQAAALASGTDAYRRAIVRNSAAGPEQAEKAAQDIYLVAAMKGMAGVGVGGKTELRGMEPLANGFVKHATDEEKTKLREAVNEGDLDKAMGLINDKVTREEWHKDPVKSNYLFAQQYNRFNSPTYKEDVADQILAGEDKRAQATLPEEPVDNPQTRTGQRTIPGTESNYTTFPGYSRTRADQDPGFVNPESKDFSLSYRQYIDPSTGHPINPMPPEAGGNLQPGDQRLLESEHPLYPGLTYADDPTVPGAREYMQAKAQGEVYAPWKQDPILNRVNQSRHPPASSWPQAPNSNENQLRLPYLDPNSPVQDPKIENRMIDPTKKPPVQQFIPSYSSSSAMAWSGIPQQQYQQNPPEFVSQGELISFSSFAEARHVLSDSLANRFWWWNTEAPKIGFTPDKIRDGKNQDFQDFVKMKDALTVHYDWKPIGDQNRESSNIPDIDNTFGKKPGGVDLRSPNQSPIDTFEGTSVPKSNEPQQEIPIEQQPWYTIEQNAERQSRAEYESGKEDEIVKKLASGKRLQDLTPDEQKFMQQQDVKYKTNYKTASKDLLLLQPYIPDAVGRLTAVLKDPASKGKTLTEIFSQGTPQQVEQNQRDIQLLSNYANAQGMLDNGGMPTGSGRSWLAILQPEDFGDDTQRLLAKYENFGYLPATQKKAVKFTQEEMDQIRNMEENKDPRLKIIYDNLRLYKDRLAAENFFYHGTPDFDRNNEPNWARTALNERNAAAGRLLVKKGEYKYALDKEGNRQVNPKRPGSPENAPGHWLLTKVGAGEGDVFRDPKYNLGDQIPYTWASYKALPGRETSLSNWYNKVGRRRDWVKRVTHTMPPVSEAERSELLSHPELARPKKEVKPKVNNSRPVRTRKNSTRNDL